MYRSMSRKKKKTEQANESFPLSGIKVVGVGGGGGNAVSRMSKNFIRGVDFVAINTDHQDLDHCAVRHKVYIGRNLTRGLGTGMNPDLGRQAGEENRSEIAEALKGADLIFIAAGLGGGTGSGTSPVVAEVAKQTGALTFAFVTKPFAFEGSQRQRVAEEALMKLKDKVDALIVVPNDRIFSIISKETPIMKAFEAIDDVLKRALEGIVELIVSPGIINVDYADVKTVMQDAGSAIVGVGVASGQDRALQAVNQALNSPLLEVSPEGARGVVLGISGSRDLRMNEINEAAKLVAQTVDPGARIIFGAYYDRKLKPNQIKITLIATGFNGSSSANSLFSGNFFGGTKASYSNDATPLSASMQGDAKLKAEEKRDRGAGADADGKMPPALSDFINPAQKAEKSKVKKTDSDVWDIPTFLRRKKK